MGLWSTLRATRKAALAGRRDQRLAVTPGIMKGGRGDPPARDAAGLLLAFNTSPWLHTTVEHISRATAAPLYRIYAPWAGGTFASRRLSWQDALLRLDPVKRHALRDKMLEHGDLVEIPEHPFLTLLYGNQTIFVGQSLRQLTQTYLEITGEAFWALDTNSMGAVDTALPIPPHWVWALPTKDAPFYKVRFGQLHAEIPLNKMIRFHRPNPVNPYGRGVGIAQSLTDELNIDEYASKTLSTHFFNNAQIDFVVSPKPGEEMAPEDSKMLEQRFLETHQGFWRAHLPWFVSRPVEITPVSHTFQQQQITELRDSLRDAITQAHGLPPEIFGNIENANRSTIDSASYLFLTYQIVPRCEFNRQCYQRQVDTYDPKRRALCDYDSPLSEDNQFQLQAMQAMSSTVRVNEWRALQKQPPLSDEDGGNLFVVDNTKGAVKLTDAKRMATTKPPGPDAQPKPPISIVPSNKPKKKQQRAANS